MERKTMLHSFLSLFLTVMLTGCSLTPAVTDGSTSGLNTPKVSLVAMKGPTGMGILPYVEEQEQKGILDFRIEKLPEEVVVGLGKGDIDVAAIPANLAATLFQKLEGELQAAAVIVTNVLYIAENGDTIKSIADLKGRTLYSTGRGATPEAALTLLLEGASLQLDTDVRVEYSSEAAEVAAKFLARPGSIALLQEPFLTSVRDKNEMVRVPLDLDELWRDQFGPDAAIVTGVLVARKDFIEENQAWFDGFLDEYEASVAYVNDDPVQGAKLIEEYGIMDAATAEAAIPHAGLSFIRGDAMKEKLAGYLLKLNGYDPQLIGGALPTDDFYYLGD